MSDSSSATRRDSLLTTLRSKRSSYLSRFPLNGQDVHGNTPLKLAKLLTICPKCGRSVGASRFAPHLEKCQSRLSNSSPIKTNDGSVYVNGDEPHEELDWSKKIPMMRVNTPTIQELTVLARKIRLPCWTCTKIEQNPQNNMIMCDGCSHIHHLTCLTPRLSEFPIGPWFCKRCTGRLIDSPSMPGTIVVPRPDVGVHSDAVQLRGVHDDVGHINATHMTADNTATSLAYTVAHIDASHIGAADTNAAYTGAADTIVAYTGAADTNVAYTGAADTNAVHTGATYTGVAYTAAVQSGATRTGVFHTGAPHTGVPHAGAPHTGVPHAGAPHTGVPHTGVPHTGVPHTGATHTMDHAAETHALSSPHTAVAQTPTDHTPSYHPTSAHTSSTESSPTAANAIVIREPRLERCMTALEKIARGRLPATFDIVSYGCDWCDNDIAPGNMRTRCLICGEFDLCETCSNLVKSKKYKDGNLMSIEDPQIGHHYTHVVATFRVPSA